MATSTTHIILLRGINVGGKNRIPMADLRALLADLGYDNPRTLLQSGNALVEARDTSAAVARAVEGAIERTFALNISVVTRTAAELAAVLAANPLRDVAIEGKAYHVHFLSAPPAPGALAALDPAALEPERFAVIGREIYTWTPGGIHASPLARLLTERRLGAVPTARNWNTVEKLAALAQG